MERGNSAPARLKQLIFHAFFMPRCAIRYAPHPRFN